VPIAREHDYLPAAFELDRAQNIANLQVPTLFPVRQRATDDDQPLRVGHNEEGQDRTTQGLARQLSWRKDCTIEDVRLAWGCLNRRRSDLFLRRPRAEEQAIVSHLRANMNENASIGSVTQRCHVTTLSASALMRLATLYLHAAVSSQVERWPTQSALLLSAPAVRNTTCNPRTWIGTWNGL